MLVLLVVVMVSYQSFQRPILRGTLLGDCWRFKILIQEDCLSLWSILELLLRVDTFALPYPLRLCPAYRAAWMLLLSISSTTGGELGVCHWSLFPESSLPEHGLFFFLERNLSWQLKGNCRVRPQVPRSGRVGDQGGGVHPGTHLLCSPGSSIGHYSPWRKSWPCYQNLGLHFRGMLDVAGSKWNSVVGQSPVDRMGGKSSPLFPVHALSWT